MQHFSTTATHPAMDFPLLCNYSLGKDNKHCFQKTQTQESYMYHHSAKILQPGDHTVREEKMWKPAVVTSKPWMDVIIAKKMTDLSKCYPKPITTITSVSHNLVRPHSLTDHTVLHRKTGVLLSNSTLPLYKCTSLYSPTVRLIKSYI